MRINNPSNKKVKKIHLLVSNIRSNYEISGNITSLTVPSIFDQDVLALDLIT